MKNFMLKLYTKAQMLREDHGQDLIEYALLAALLSVVLAVTIPDVTAAIKTVFDNVITALAPAAG